MYLPFSEIKIAQKKEHFMKKVDEYLRRAEALKELRKEEAKLKEHKQVCRFNNMMHHITS